jgi:hypothetical protein
MTKNTPLFEFVDEPVEIVSTTTLSRAAQSLALSLVGGRRPADFDADTVTIGTGAPQYG